MNEQKSAYIVSSLKYRPQTFDQVVGQDHISRTLKNAVLRQRLANGYLFTGPRGVGKTTTARILAKSLNCENPQDANPCNQCNHCEEITAGRNLDVLEVDGASTRGIDAIRELREVVKYPPTNSKYRIYIIDEVHMLTKEAFNALLKTLEEPPPQVLFIFATTEPQKVPLTILSRCQRYDFRRISVELMAQHLQNVAGQEGFEVDDEALRLLARKGGGSVRDSMSLLDQVAALADKKINHALVREVLGILDSQVYYDLTDLIVGADTAALMSYLRDLLEQGISINEFLLGMTEHFRNLLIMKVSGDANLLELSDTEIEKLRVQVEDLEERDLIRQQNILQQTQRDMRNASNQTVALELMILKMARLTGALTLDQIVSGKVAGSAQSDKPEGKKEQTKLEIPPPPLEKVVKEAEDKQKASVPPPQAPVPEQMKEPVDSSEEPGDSEADPEPAVEKSSIDFDTIKAKWPAFVEAVNKESHTLGSFVAEGEPSSLEGNILELHFTAEQAYHIERLEKEQKRVEDVLEKVMGTGLKLKFVKNNDKAAKKAENDELLGHPTSQHVLNIFDGEIVDK